MRAVRFDGELRVVDDRLPTIGSQDALVRVSRAGICSTDLEIIAGYLSFDGVLGHEFVGIVEECSARDWVGRRVVGEINLSCGECTPCRSGRARHCDARRVLGIRDKDGCFAQYVALPIVNLHEIPASVPDDRAAFVEPLAAAFQITRQLDLDPGWRAAVIGDGKLGLLATMVLRRSGCDVTLIGRHVRKLEIAENVGARIAGPGERGRFDLVVEATGKPEGLHAAVACTRPEGKLVLKSTFHGVASVHTAPIVVDEITIVGSRCGPFEPAIEALRTGEIDPTPLLDATYPLEDAMAAIKRAGQPGALKVALAP